MGLVTNMQNARHEGLLTQHLRYYMRISNCQTSLVQLLFTKTKEGKREKTVPYDETKFSFGG